MRKLLGILLLCVSFSANAAAIFIGSFNVADGPYWEDNPLVYSAREAAALIFGGVFSDYAISINSSLDPATITYSAYYDGYGDHSGRVFNQDYKFDLTGNGYSSYLGEDPVVSAYSAYVSDGLFAQNYVWRIMSPIPEPQTWLMLAAGIALLAAASRGRKRASEILQ